MMHVLQLGASWIFRTAPVSHAGLSLSCVQNFSNYGYYAGYAGVSLMEKLSLTDFDAL